MWKINPNWARGLRHRWAAKLNVTPTGSQGKSAHYHSQFS